MKTMKEFLESTHVPESLARAVIRKVGGFREFQQIALDVTNHGADAGFSGFVYYSDTVPFAYRNRDAIQSLARGFSHEFGCKNLVEFVAGFRCLSDLSSDEVYDGLSDRKSDAYTSVQNALAWFALEETCRSYVEG